MIERTGLDNLWLESAAGRGDPSLVPELLERCMPLLEHRDWPGRLIALMQMHDQLRDDVRDFSLFCTIFPLFIERVIERLGDGPIVALEQAQIYANSARKRHRDLAGQWLERHYAANSASVNA